MALLNTSDKQVQSQVFELEERLKRLACKRGCFVVSLLEMCRSQATNLKTQNQYDQPERLANGDSNTGTPIVEKSFAEAKMQDELYARHELKSGFDEELITKAKKAFDEAVAILEAA